MGLFKYTAVTSGGKTIKSMVLADSLQEAKLKIAKEEIFLTKIQPVSLKKKGIELKSEELLNFTRDLAKLIRAGLPLFEALSALAEKHEGTLAYTLLLDLLEQVKEGKSLSQALAFHKRSFNPLYISMIQTAEKSATLEVVLEDIALLLTKSMTLKKQVIGALSYPCLLGLFAFGILGVLLFFIIPSLSELFEGRALHPFTSFVLGLSQWAERAKFFLLIMAVFFAGGIVMSFQVQSAKVLFYRSALYLPWIKELMIKLAFIRFSRASSSLLRAGVPLVDALQLSKNVMNQPVLEEEIAKVQKGVLEGKSLSRELKESLYTPQLVVRMLGIAEESGDLGAMFQNIAQIYEGEVDKSLEKMTKVLQPLLLLLIGAIVGFVLLSVLLPLTDVSSFVIN